MSLKGGNMKIITLLLMITSISAAHAQIYKCPGSVEGKFTYQERPCKGAKVDEHTLKTIPIDKQKIAEAQAKLAKELDPEAAQKQEESPKETDSGAKTETGVTPPPVAEKPPINPPPPPAASQKIIPTSSKDVLPKSVAIPPVSTPKVATATTVPVVLPKAAAASTTSPAPAVIAKPAISTPKNK
jgi:hypothetical protein